MLSIWVHSSQGLGFWSILSQRHLVDLEWRETQATHSVHTAASFLPKRHYRLLAMAPNISIHVYTSHTGNGLLMWHIIPTEHWHRSSEVSNEMMDVAPPVFIEGKEQVGISKSLMRDRSFTVDY